MLRCAIDNARELSTNAMDRRVQRRLEWIEIGKLGKMVEGRMNVLKERRTTRTTVQLL